MGRVGFQPEEVGEVVQIIANLPNLQVEGLMTHFATADDQDKQYSYEQVKKFRKVVQDIENLGIDIPIKHVANSAAIIDLPEFKYDLVRPGIMSYGLWPSAEVDHQIDIRPVLNWKARIVHVKEVPGGTGVSYGRTYITEKPSKIATLPLGYADGYSRHLSNKGQVLLKGERAPIIGRVCMDQCMININHIPEVQVGDEVVLIGKQGEDFISAEEMASWINTINYEITCLVNKRVPRYYIGETADIIEW